MQQSREDDSKGRRGCTYSSCVFAALLFVLASGWELSSASAPSSEPSAQSTISVRTELVLLPVRVTDAKGEFVPGLGSDDFHVYENGQLQKVTFFRKEDNPVTVGLVVDHSGSMSPKLQEVATAVFEFAHSSNRQDEMFVVNFNERATLQPLGGKQFTNDAMELDQAITNVTASGETALYDAIVEGFRHLELGTHDKKALIIVSDGGDDASQHKLSQVLKLAQQSHVVVYCIGLIGQTLEEENPGVLRRLSKDTGGIAYFPDSAESVIDTSKQIAIDLREQYTLGYIPPKGKGDSSFRTVQVKADAPGYGKLHARTKPGYFPADEQHPSRDSGGKAP